MAFFDQVLPVAASSLLSDAGTKVSEAATKVTTSFSNGTGNFTKVTAGAPDLNEAAATYQVQAGKIAAQAGDISAAQQEVARLAARFPLTYNSMSASAAAANAASGDASVSASQINQTAVSPADDGHIVKLQEIDGPLVKFLVMPEVFESRSVEYEAVAPPQSPSAFQKYKGTAPTQWSVNATLTCRNINEATANLEIINTLRGWTMPFFGENTRVAYPKKLGAPPPVLWFSGFREQMVGPVQVVMTSATWTFPQDVDYIPARGYRTNSREPTGELVPFPTVMKVQIQLVESWSTDQFNGFDLSKFRAGHVKDAFTPLPSSGVPRGAQQGPQSGIRQPQEEAQTSAFTGATGEGARAARVVDAGYLSSVPDYSNEGRNYPGPVKGLPRRGGAISELRRAAYVAPDFVSQGGGEFGGGGATGKF
jgi:hypothetical protein